MDKVIVTTLGAAAIGFIYWFFFGKRELTTDAKTNWNITVDGGYKPATITIPKGKPSSITFTRKDPNSCLEEIVIPDFKIKKFLPLDKDITVVISPTVSGTFPIHCDMNMFHGKILVV
jgi:plastocyanin domain-containing protein